MQHGFLGSFCEEDALSIWITYLHDRAVYLYLRNVVILLKRRIEEGGCIFLLKKFSCLAKEDRRERERERCDL